MSAVALKPETLAAQALGRVDEPTRALIPPIHMASTYEREGDLSYLGRVYSRTDNPTYDAAADTLTALEGGAATLLFASGMAAATAVFQALDPGDHVLVPKIMYWGLRSWLFGFANRWGIDAEEVGNGDLDALQRGIRPGRTKLIWIETPANPTWEVSGIAATAEIASRAGARLVADSTVSTPVLTRPIALGADIVMHSATKYLNGHSDLVAGTLTTAVEDDFWTRIKAVQAQNGGIAGAFEAWLLQRGLRTLFPRIRWQCASALSLAERLANHPAVAKVLYPGLPDFPGHGLARRQMQGGFGGMLSIRIKGGTETAVGVTSGVHVWKRATSLGGVESLIEHRASIEGAGSAVPQDLLRLSVGLEAVDDLYADLDEALNSAIR